MIEGRPCRTEMVKANRKWLQKGAAGVEMLT